MFPPPLWRHLRPAIPLSPHCPIADPGENSSRTVDQGHLGHHTLERRAGERKGHRHPRSSRARPEPRRGRPVRADSPLRLQRRAEHERRPRAQGRRQRGSSTATAAATPTNSSGRRRMPVLRSAAPGVPARPPSTRPPRSRRSRSRTVRVPSRSPRAATATRRIRTCAYHRTTRWATSTAATWTRAPSPSGLPIRTGSTGTGTASAAKPTDGRVELAEPTARPRPCR